MTSSTSLPVYTQSLGTAFTGATVVSAVAPLPTDIVGPNGPFKIGQIWVDTSTSSVYILAGLTASSGTISATWEQITSSSGLLSFLITSTGADVFPIQGGINVVGSANQLFSDFNPDNANTLAFQFTDGISIGSYADTAPPTGGLLVPGQSFFGSDAPDDRAFFEITNPGTFIFTELTSGTTTTQSSITYFDNTECIPAVSGGNLISFDSNLRAWPPVGVTAVSAACFAGALFVDQNFGTITNAYTFLANSFTGPLTGTITNAYGGYFNTPGVGTNQIPLYADGISVGTPGIAPPTEGAYIAGQVGIGNNASVNASALLQMSTVTQGFLPPVMTTGQKDAIASPATGLVVYDSGVGGLSYYNGTSWLNLIGV